MAPGDKVNADKEKNKKTNTPRQKWGGWWMLKLHCFSDSRHSLAHKTPRYEKIHPK